MVYEGLHTYGGMAGRDMEAHGHRHRGVGAGRPHPRAASARCATSASCSTDWDIPIVQPVGGHAIFLDARRFYPHLPQDQLPGPDAGRRALPRFRHPLDGARHRLAPAATRRPATTSYPKLELMRLTIPRRVYTQAHMDVVAESVKAVYDARDAGARA